MSILPAFLSDNLDEVVFEGRNQAYGAYQLRQDYERRVASAGGITLSLCVALLLGWAAWRQLAPSASTPLRTTGIIELIKPPIVPVVEHPQAVAPPPARVRPAATHVAPATPTEVAKDNVPQPHIAPVTPSEIVDGPVGPAIPAPTTASNGLETGGNTSEATTGPAPAPVSNAPFEYVEKMPEFAGGQAALLRYLRDHLHYPGRALAAGIGGKVFLSFVVGADGSISEVTILKGLGYGLDEEAQRVVRQMPTWTPGFQSKHAVPVRFTLPITFQYQ